MKKHFLFLVFILASCDMNYITTPIGDRSAFQNAIRLDSLKDQTISMNAQFGPYQIILKDAKSSIDSINFLVESSNWWLVDGNSIVLDQHQDPATLTIYPIIGQTGATKISLLVCDGSDCDTSSFVLTVIASDANKSYPTILNKLDQATLDAKQSELNKRLGTHYIATMDSFGLLGHFGVIRRGQSSITDPSKAISIAKSVLLTLADFSNISDTSTLNIEQATNHDPTPLNSTDWQLIFKKQTYNSTEVWDTRILVLVSDNFVSLDWHHYKYVFIPRNDVMSKERAKKLLVGSEITYECWGPTKFTITDASIKTEGISLCIFPLMKDGALEMRVTWKIPISSFPSDPVDWYYFIDVLTGETVGVYHTFVC